VEENDFDSLKRAGTDAMRAVGDAFSSIDFSEVTRSVGKAVEDIGQAIAGIGKATTSPYVIEDPDASGRASRHVADGVLLILLAVLPLVAIGVWFLILWPIAGLALFVLAGILFHRASRSIAKGKHERSFADALSRIDHALGEREAIPVAELAKKVHMPVSQLLEVLGEAIERGLIPEGHLVPEGKAQMLYLTNAAAYDAEAQRKSHDAVPDEGSAAVEDARVDVPSIMADLPEDAREVLSSASASIEKIRGAAAGIQDAEVRAELEGICSKTEQISAYIMHHPETAPLFRRAATYYLPTTAKLAASFAELEGHDKGARVETTLEDLRASFKEMEGALSRLSDELVLDQSMDVRSDIDVMRTMLRQDGLSDE